MLEKNQTYQVLGVDISAFSKDDFYQVIEERFQDKTPSSPALFIVTVNPEIVVQGIIDKELKHILEASSINTADGIGISWAVKVLYGKNIDRITGSDSLEKICRLCALHSEPVFFYGAKPTVAEKTAARLKKRIDQLSVSGTYSPERVDLRLEELPYETRCQLEHSSVIFVALGSPAQEKWIHTNLPKLPNCKLITGIGGSFDFIAGEVKRAPEWMRENGFEWLYRLYLQPWRWRRMLKYPVFVINVLFLKYTSKG